jgi:uncharacterized protein (TIGR04255 family)
MVIQAQTVTDPPKKLKHDAILEAIVEIQFDHQTVSEIVVGALAGNSLWAGYQSVRLPIADFPAGLRDSDPALRHQAIIQLQRPQPGELVKIGPRAISLHHLAPYDGWDSFSSRVSVLIDVLTSTIPSMHVTRTGLRYVNALTPAHGFESIWDLQLTLEVGGQKPSSDFTAVYRSYGSDGMLAQVTVAAPAFVNNLSVPNAVALIDIDVSCQTPLGAAPPEDLRVWFERAHSFEKEAFFSLWPVAKVESLREA